MKEGLIFGLLFIVFLSSFAAANSVNDEITKITNYAEDYETGNINYAQFLVYSSAIRESLNEKLGTRDKEFGGILTAEQLKPFGEPTEETKWVWSENKKQDARIDKPVPVWRNLIFDGKKIQVWLTAWPNMFGKEGNETLFYRLNLDVNFKKPEQELDMNRKIDGIQALAKEFNANPTRENGENLAKESVNVERKFESYMRQKGGKCEDIMNVLFGAENRRATQKLIVHQMDFYEADNFAVVARLEMCDECEWNWVNLDFWFEGMGPGFKEPKVDDVEMAAPEQFENLGVFDLKERIRTEIGNIKQLLENGEFEEAMKKRAYISAIGQAWDKKSNDIWKQLDKMFESRYNSPEAWNNYGWIKIEREKRATAESIRKANYEERKEFYLEMFSGYEKKEFYYTQIEFEKRLVEEFKERGQEICDNNKDDNENQKIDCEDEQCGGKICGRQPVSVEKDNQTFEEVKDLYCIAKICQLKEDRAVEKKESVCGNHVCEENEAELCAEDCAVCPVYEAIECNGTIMFKGKDENNCSLEPICVKEKKTCAVNEDCAQPLCGRAECIEGVCQLIELTECKKEECVHGGEKTQQCSDGSSLIFEKCIEGKWVETGEKCIEVVGGAAGGGENITETMIIEDEEKTIEENRECDIKEDCGGESDVCSNGECVSIPIKSEKAEEEATEEETNRGNEEGSGVIDEEEAGDEIETEKSGENSEEETEGASPEQEPEEEHTEESSSGGEGIITAFLSFFRGSITGFSIEEGSSESSEPAEKEAEPSGEDSNRGENVEEAKEEIKDNAEEEDIVEGVAGETAPGAESEEQRDYEQERRENEERREMERERRKEESERRERECKEMCDRGCYDALTRPCADSCIQKSGCIDKVAGCDGDIKSCEEKCSEEKNEESCIKDCNGKCVKGEDMAGYFDSIREPGEQGKEEKGVFNAGGVCRTASGKTESHVWFNGWGEPFEEIQRLKFKYYSGGQADWCKEDIENLKKQRKEFEISMNNEFVVWFFEKYLANSAEDWEQHVSGIFELYWKDVELNRQAAERMFCLGKKESLFENLISVQYETEFGKLEFWEEKKTAKLPGMEEEVEIISPYMKVWIFPPRGFISYEMKKSTDNHEFPGPPEEKARREREGFIPEEEKAKLMEDEGFMGLIKKISGKFGGYADIVVQVKDYAKDEVVMNLYVKINENDLIEVMPMPYKEVPAEDVRIELDFERVYDLIYTSEKDMNGGRTETPPWDKQARPVEKIREVVNGIRMYFKARSVLNSAKVYPEEAESEIMPLAKSFFNMMMKEGMKGEDKEENGENIQGENKEED